MYYIQLFCMSFIGYYMGVFFYNINNYHIQDNYIYLYGAIGSALFSYLYVKY